MTTVSFRVKVKVGLRIRQIFRPHPQMSKI